MTEKEVNAVGILCGHEIPIEANVLRLLSAEQRALLPGPHSST